MLLAMCELPPKAKRMTMESFVVTDGNRRAWEIANEIIAGELRWLAMFGKRNTGKSHLAMAICQEWIARRRPARYVNVPVLLDELKEGFKDGSSDYRFKVYCTIPLLVMDDLGVENATSWAAERLTTIINQRLLNELPLIVTMNMPLEDLPIDQEYHRIESRLRREPFCRVVEVRP